MGDFENIVRLGLLPNCPVTVEDVRIANKIYGAEIAALKGKTTRGRPIPVQLDNVYVPPELIDLHKDVTLVIDVMFINKLAFFITMSRNLKFITVQYVRDRKTTTLAEGIKSVFEIYMSAGFRVRHVLVDGEFEHLRQSCTTMGSNLNTISANEHVPDIERMIRVVKERVRSTRSTLPFRKIPERMTIEMVLFCIFWLNHMPNKNGISNSLSPRMIMTGNRPNFKTHCRIPFGAYAQTHEEPQPSNDVSQARTQGAICLGPLGNKQGGYKFLSLTSGKPISRRAFTELPMPADVVQAVHDLADKDNQPEGLVFADRSLRSFDLDDTFDDAATYIDANITGMESAIQNDNQDLQHDIEQNENDAARELTEEITVGGNRPEVMEEFEPESERNETETAGLDEPENVEISEPATAGVDEPNITGVPAAEVKIEPDSGDDKLPEAKEATNSPMPNNDEDHEVETSQSDEQPTDEAKGPDANEDAAEESPTGESDDDTVQDDGEIEIDDKDAYHPSTLTPSVQKTYGLRPKRKRHYSYVHQALTQVILTQYSLKKGLEKFKEKGEQAVRDELQQLHDKDVFKPVASSELSDQQKKDALGSLMFLKEKRCGRLKARACANGNKQREIYSKEDVTSPTVSVESVLITSVIDAFERRHVATTDIPGAYLTADMDDFVTMRFEGRLAELMVMVDPVMYRPFLTTGNARKALLFVVLKKALYGCVKSGILFYKRLTKDLTEYGFEINPYDHCVANKMINGSQCTILWYVDDLKISHKEKKVVDEILAWLESVYGEIRTTKGKQHTYVGMDLDFSKAGEVEVSMKGYLEETIDDFPVPIEGIASTPASLFLFQVNPNSSKLSEDRVRAFHTAVAKLLFVTKRERGDIMTAVSFLTTRVKEPDEDDWKKLVRLLRCIKGTLDLTLTLSADNLNILKWWVDGAFAVHPDMRSHTGGSFTMGEGMLVNVSTKQKLVTRSLTEAELVATNDVLPQIIWTRYFLEAQGYGVTVNRLYQDNMSAMLLETNGRWSSSKRTKHINIRYFFIKDRVEADELTIDYCPTDEMIADAHTKALQGSKFFRFRKLILNLKEDVE